MKKTLVLGVSTALVMTTLTGCVFDRPVTTKYGIDPPDKLGIFQPKEEPVPDEYNESKFKMKPNLIKPSINPTTKNNNWK